MPPLSEAARIKKVVELFLVASKVDPIINAHQNAQIIECITQYGYSDREAEQMLDGAFDKMDRGLLRSTDQIISEVANAFRRRDHIYVLEHTQTILEAGNVTPEAEAFFNKCVEALYHPELFEQ